MNTGTFDSFKLNKEIINILKKSGIITPTPIQTLAIPVISSGNDIIAKANTGTGKTLSFLLPILNKLAENKPSPSDTDENYTKVIILTPTRELAIQITSEAEMLASVLELSVLAVYGGKDIGGQLRKLKKAPDIVVATPGRLLDHLRRETVLLDKVEYIVIDEADMMLEAGFKGEIEIVLGQANEKRNLLFFSATISSQVKKLAYKYSPSPVEIDADAQEDSKTLKNDESFKIPSTVKQYMIETTDRRKQADLILLLEEKNPFLSIIFCRTKRRADVLELALYQKGFNCGKIHSGMTQSQREKIMKSFRKLDLQYLIATDVVSRGLDITGVTHIINYDTPEDADTYIHRVGRTGRANKDGESYTFVAEKDKPLLKKIEDALGMKLTQYTSS